MRGVEYVQHLRVASTQLTCTCTHASKRVDLRANYDPTLSYCSTTHIVVGYTCTSHLYEWVRCNCTYIPGWWARCCIWLTPTGAWAEDCCCWCCCRVFRRSCAWSGVRWLHSWARLATAVRVSVCKGGSGDRVWVCVCVRVCVCVGGGSGDRNNEEWQKTTESSLLEIVGPIHVHVHVHLRSTRYMYMYVVILTKSTFQHLCFILSSRLFVCQCVTYMCM